MQLNLQPVSLSGLRDDLQFTIPKNFVVSSFS